jgi:hypothetical protein
MRTSSIIASGLAWVANLRALGPFVAISTLYSASSSTWRQDFQVDRIVVDDSDVRSLEVYWWQWHILGLHVDLFE